MSPRASDQLSVEVPLTGMYISFAAFTYIYTTRNQRHDCLILPVFFMSLSRLGCFRVTGHLRDPTLRSCLGQANDEEDYGCCATGQGGLIGTNLEKML